MTRDNWFWKAAPVVATVLAVITAVTDPATALHISPVAVNWMKVVLTALAALGFFSTSPLAGKNDANKIGMLLLICALAGATLIGCGPKTAGPVLPSAVPNIPAHVDDVLTVDVNAAAIYALGILEQTGNAALEVVKAEIAIKNDLPLAVDTAFRKYAGALATDARSTIAWIRDTTTLTWPQLKAKLDPILGSARALAALVPQLNGGGGGFLATVKAFLGGIAKLATVGAGGAKPAFVGGVR